MYMYIYEDIDRLKGITVETVCDISMTYSTIYVDHAVIHTYMESGNNMYTTKQSIEIEMFVLYVLPKEKRNVSTCCLSPSHLTS